MSAAEYSFDGVWAVLEKHGLCDAHGSAEYRRVRALWEANGSNGDIAMFVITHCNFLPVPADECFTVPVNLNGPCRLIVRVEVTNGKA